jgi:hypothetical protein
MPILIPKDLVHTMKALGKCQSSNGGELRVIP